MLLTNGSKYKIFDVEHTIRDDLIIEEPIPMCSQETLESLYKLLKYTTDFLEYYNIDYCLDSGSLLGYYRHDGIIPWDNDIDIMIFREGYFKLLELMNEYNKNNDITMMNVTPGFKLFYKKNAYGDIVVYDYNCNINKYKMSYPYIKNKPTFIAGKLFENQIYKKNDLFPTKKVKFEDLYVRVPNNTYNILINIYSGNLLECKFFKNRNNIRIFCDYNFFKILKFGESITLNEYLLFIYVIIINLSIFIVNIE
jgi:hypothetical protein